MLIKSLNIFISSEIESILSRSKKKISYASYQQINSLIDYIDKNIITLNESFLTDYNYKIQDKFWDILLHNFDEYKIPENGVSGTQICLIQFITEYIKDIFIPTLNEKNLTEDVEQLFNNIISNRDIDIDKAKATFSESISKFETKQTNPLRNSLTISQKNILNAIKK